MPDVWTVNAKLSKMFRISEKVNLDTYVLCYNLLDAMTPLLYNYSEVPTLNKTIAVMDSRTFEIGFRFTF